jgi:hypothetical protein
MERCFAEVGLARQVYYEVHLASTLHDMAEGTEGQTGALPPRVPAGQSRVGRCESPCISGGGADGGVVVVGAVVVVVQACVRLVQIGFRSAPSDTGVGATCELGLGG